MGFTNFPNGVTSFGIPQIGNGSIPVTLTGKYLFVDSVRGTAGGDGLTPTSALSTIDAAINKCTAGKNDVIVVAARHVETLSAVSSIVLDVSDVQIVGLGSGDARPTITIGIAGTAGATAAIVVSAAGCSISNILFTSGVTEILCSMLVSGTGFTLDGCEVIPSATSLVTFLATTSAADKLTIRNCKFRTTAACTANGYMVLLVGADDAVIVDNSFHCVSSNNAASGFLGCTGTASLRVFISRNSVVCAGASVIAMTLLTGSTGIVSHNCIGTAKTDAAGSLVGDAVYKFQNFVTNEVAKSGFVDPAIDTAG